MERNERSFGQQTFKDQQSNLIEVKNSLSASALALLESVADVAAASAVTAKASTPTTSSKRVSTTATASAATSTFDALLLGLLAVLAADRFVVKALGLVKLLLAGGKDKVVAAVLASDGFIAFSGFFFVVVRSGTLLLGLGGGGSVGLALLGDGLLFFFFFLFLGFFFLVVVIAGLLFRFD